MRGDRHVNLVVDSHRVVGRIALGAALVRTSMNTRLSCCFCCEGEDDVSYCSI